MKTINFLEYKGYFWSPGYFGISQDQLGHISSGENLFVGADHW
jgi:hypothetical protein